MNSTNELKEVVLQAQVEAALQGHDLTPFEPVSERGFQATCRACGNSVWVDISGLMYSLLADDCVYELPNTFANETI